MTRLLLVGTEVVSTAGAPVVGATVALSDTAGAAVLSYVNLASNTPVAATTDAAGNLQQTATGGLAPKPWAVEVTLPAGATHVALVGQVGAGPVFPLVAYLPTVTPAQIGAADATATTTALAGKAAATDLVVLTSTVNNKADTSAVVTSLAGKASTSDLAALAATVPPPLAVRSVTASTTAVAGELLQVDATGGNRTVTPPASPGVGKQVTVVKTDASANTVTWNAPVNSGTTAVLTGQWAGATFTWNGSLWVVSAVAASYSAGTVKAGDLLSHVRYAPASTQTVTDTTGVMKPMDSTNGRITFTVPASGKVQVRLSALGSPGPTNTMSWGLLAADGTTVVSVQQIAYDSSTPLRQTDVYDVAGLTPGATVTYIAGFYRSFAGGSAVSTVTIAPNAPLFLDVLAA